MTTDDFLLDQLERTQRHQTRRRRDDRSHRRRMYVIGGFALIAMVMLGGPSFFSHSPMGRSMLQRYAADYGIDADAESVRVGWITPLEITGLTIVGTSGGSEVVVDSIGANLTVIDLMKSTGNDLGQISMRGVNVACSVAAGKCSLEDDFPLLFDSSGESGTTSGSLVLQDVTVSVSDAATGATWNVTQSNADIELKPDTMRAKFAGVLTEPSGSGGSLQGTADWIAPQGSSGEWKLEINSESLPLSVVSLVRLRFHDAASIPLPISGDATGSIRLFGASDGTVEASVRQFEIRNLTAANPQTGPRVWTNQLASINGDLVLAGDRIIGRGLSATTDFASATFDGAFPRSMTLVGAEDNPIRWLESLDGTATAEIDLPSLNRAMPGILPLRDGAELLSGRVTAKLDSLPNADTRRSRLSIRSDALRARAGGRAVVIEPIQVTATVTRDQGRIKAEHFEWNSTFASAIGNGDLRSGQADVQIDFGRLSAMLRPIIETSDATLGGAARGNIRWNATDDNVWRLSGEGLATDLLITLPNGQVFKRPSLRGGVEAVGRWGGQSLSELSQAKASVSSAGLELKAELTQAVRQPSSTQPMPMRIQGEGRIETLVDTFANWLPRDLHDADGGFSLTARGEVSTLATRITGASIELTEPRVAYGDRYFSQPHLKMQFDGDYAWPQGDLRARSFTLAGDAVSAAVKGEATADNVNLEIAWRAKLERVQGSVRKRIAERPGATVQQVGYRPGVPVKTDDWLVMGDCEGNLVVTSQNQVLDISTQATGKNVAVIQPPSASADFQTVGPMPRRPSAARSSTNSSGARVVWAEPNVRIDGMVRYDTVTGRGLADSLQVAGDWFATTLSGHAQWNEARGEILMQGPARLKMNEVAQRLSSLSGVSIHAEGIQETPLEIHALRNPDGTIGFGVAGNLGWDACDVAGVALGPASVPVRLTETSVLVAPAIIPVGQGQLNLAGQVHYRPGPVWLQVNPGVIARSVRLTPEMTNRWLKYLTPLASDTAQVDGTFGAEIDEAFVVIDQPEQSHVVGRLNIENIQMASGPLTDQIIGGVDQLKSLSSLSGTQPAPRTSRTLITMPAQTVDFTVDRGIVSHQRLYFQLGRAQVVTSGHVSINGELDMVAQVPLDASWLGRELQGLAGQPVTLPIKGSLSQPRLDATELRQVMGKLGIQAVQSTAENYLQQQLNRGIDKIFGR